MITRMWRGWASVETADAYEELLRSTILPEIHRVTGYRGASVLRRDVADGVEFVTLTLFDSLDSVRGFAGEDYEQAVVLPEAHALLSRYEQTAIHYETVIQPD